MEMAWRHSSEALDRTAVAFESGSSRSWSTMPEPYSDAARYNTPSNSTVGRRRRLLPPCPTDSSDPRHRAKPIRSFDRSAYLADDRDDARSLPDSYDETGRSASAIGRRSPPSMKTRCQSSTVLDAHHLSPVRRPHGRPISPSHHNVHGSPSRLDPHRKYSQYSMGEESKNDPYRKYSDNYLIQRKLNSGEHLRKFSDESHLSPTYKP